MSDNNAHPGVRSLLAKFENSQSPITSPPSRGRSPASSDTPGSTRQLSKVRASFVTVEGAIQSSPGSPLRKTSGRSDSPGIFGPKINADDVELRRQNNVVSPTPGGHGSSQTNVLDGVGSHIQTQENRSMKNEERVSESKETAAPAQSTSSSSQPASVDNEKAAGSAQTSVDDKEKVAQRTVTKRPSHVHTVKRNATSKPATQTATTTASKPIASNGSAKSSSAREVANERCSALAHKPSRLSLNPATKTTTSRMTRGSTPSADAHKAATGRTTSTNKPRPKSPTRPVRLPSSMTAQTQSSNAKHGGAGTTSGNPEKPAASLTRKPSTLKSSTASTGAVRRQTSRPSLPAQSTLERPSSRVSDIGGKPVNEGFLARMMRPTASSASKTHDKSDIKAPPKPAASKAPRPSMGRASERGVAQAKAKPAVAKSQSERSRLTHKVVSSKKADVEDPQMKAQDEKENIDEVPATIPEEPAGETNAAIIEKPEAESAPQAISEAVSEDRTESLVAEAELQCAPELTVKPTEPAVESAATEAAVEASISSVETDVPKASSSHEQANDVDISAESATAGSTSESPDQENELEAKDIEKVPAETAVQTPANIEISKSKFEQEIPKECGVEADVQPDEPVIGKDVTAPEAKEIPTGDTELAEPSQQAETATPVAISDAREIIEAKNEARSSEMVEEP